MISCCLFGECAEWWRRHKIFVRRKPRLKTASGRRISCYAKKRVPLVKSKILLVSLITVFLFGCTSKRVSEAEKQQVIAGEKILISTYSVPLVLEFVFFFLDFPDITIKSVDGEKVTSNFFTDDNQIAVDSGKHKVELKCSGRYDDQSVNYYETIEIDARPGYWYRITGSEINVAACRFYVEELAVKH